MTKNILFPEGVIKTRYFSFHWRTIKWRMWRNSRICHKSWWCAEMWICEHHEKDYLWMVSLCAIFFLKEPQKYAKWYIKSRVIYTQFFFFESCLKRDKLSQKESDGLNWWQFYTNCRSKSASVSVWQVCFNKISNSHTFHKKIFDFLVILLKIYYITCQISLSCSITTIKM